MKLVEPNEEEYALYVSAEDFSVFNLFYTDAGYKTISEQVLSRFANHYGYFIVNKRSKTISFMESIVFSIYQDKEYFLNDLIKSEKMED